jgi:hypothetical protein
MPEITVMTLSQFKGLNERRIIGQNPQETISLDNVDVRNGVVIGRKGTDEFDGITTVDADTPILGHFAHYEPASATVSLLRMTPTKMRKWNSVTHVWDDITGTALTGTSTTRPVLHTMSDEGFSVFTNEGNDQPRKYTGSGNTATLGGDPPYAKWLCPYVGFLFLFNTSISGDFDQTADAITAYFSDTPDAVWLICDGNAMVFDESPGEILAADTFGDILGVMKSDAIVQVRFTPGRTRFVRRRLHFDRGILAPLSMQKLGQTGIIFLGSDRQLYTTDFQAVRPLPLNVQRTLQEDLNIATASQMRSFVDIDNHTYKLLYQREGSTYFDAVLKYNYLSGEFSKDIYPVEFNSALGFRLSPTVASRQIASSSNLTYELNLGTNDNGTAVSRFVDIDWFQYGNPGNKWMKGAEFVFKRTNECRVRISVAVDKSSKFKFPRNFSLSGNNQAEDDVRVSYQLPSPIYGSWFKFRIEMFHDGANNQVKLKEFEAEWINLHKEAQDVPKETITNSKA